MSQDAAGGKIDLTARERNVKQGQSIEWAGKILDVENAGAAIMASLNDGESLVYHRRRQLVLTHPHTRWPEHRYREFSR